MTPIPDMIPQARWVAQRLSPTQRKALVALAEDRVHAFTAPTMAALLRWGLIEERAGAPKVTELGADVLQEIPAGS